MSRMGDQVRVILRVLGGCTRGLLISLVGCAVLCWGHQASASIETAYYYDVPSKLPLKAGVGLFNGDVTQPIGGECLKVAPPELPSKPLSYESTLTITTSSESIRNLMGVDHKVSVSVLDLAKAGVAIAGEIETIVGNGKGAVILSSESTAYWVSVQRAPAPGIEFGLPDAEFEKLCGTRVVTKEARGHRVAVAVSFDSEYGTTKGNVTAKLEVKGKVPLVGGGKSSSRLWHEFQSAASRKQLRVTVVANGALDGNTTSKLQTELRGLDNAQAALEQMSSAIGEVLKNLTTENAVCVGVWVEPWSRIRPESKATFWDDERYRALTQIKNEFEAVEEEIRVVETATADLLKDPEGQTERVALESAETELEQWRLQLGAAHDSCRTGGECVLPPRPAGVEMFRKNFAPFDGTTRLFANSCAGDGCEPTEMPREFVKAHVRDQKFYVGRFWDGVTAGAPNTNVTRVVYRLSSGPAVRAVRARLLLIQDTGAENWFRVDMKPADASYLTNVWRASELSTAPFLVKRTPQEIELNLDPPVFYYNTISGGKEKDRFPETAAGNVYLLVEDSLGRESLHRVAVVHYHVPGIDWSKGRSVFSGDVLKEPIPSSTMYLEPGVVTTSSIADPLAE